MSSIILSGIANWELVRNLSTTGPKWSKNVALLPSQYDKPVYPVLPLFTWRGKFKIQTHLAYEIYVIYCNYFWS